MISVTRCSDIAGLTADEIILGVEACDRHRRLLCGYLLNMRRGMRAVRNMIVGDLRRYLDLGAEARAADLLVVLRLFLSDYGGPEKPRQVPARHPGLTKTGLAHARHPCPDYA